MQTVSEKLNEMQKVLQPSPISPHINQKILYTHQSRLTLVTPTCWAQQERIWMKTNMNECYLCIPYHRSRRLRYSLRDRRSDLDRAQRCRRRPAQTQRRPDTHCSPGTSGSASCWKWHGDIEITHNWGYIHYHNQHLGYLPEAYRNAYKAFRKW